METNFHKSTGVSLLVGSTLAIITMILHPSGGSIEYLIKIVTPMKFAHALAILCIPFILFGFYGVSLKLLGKWKLSMLAFLIISLAFIAAMLAAIFNGLVLPSFLGEFSESFEQNLDTLELITHYSFATNKALDYVFIAGMCTAIAIYSFIIILLEQLSKWIGYLGIIILISTIIGAITGFAFTNLVGFRVFVFSIVGWILCTGASLIRSKN
ncbi:hypothetical protein [Flavivirga algicola]|uniref:DUF4386 domain-containing protein n=1 Tax=Flavivirga algicola TaxID=2729136 RepID=A0ABX1RQU1_9FLAO|nr:hypothetical protein [Flavivirga algicola]NMH85916.1 hypothetical protein [Flavivirga algicola]